MTWYHNFDFLDAMYENPDEKIKSVKFPLDLGRLISKKVIRETERYFDMIGADYTITSYGGLLIASYKIEVRNIKARKIIPYFEWLKEHCD